MTPGKFLRLVWPAAGHYCIAHPFKLPDGKTTYYHKVFGTITEAVTHIHETAPTIDVYFAVLSLAQPKVWNPAKLDPKTGVLGAFEVRTHQNMLAAKCVFWDLDVGAEATKYPTRRDALGALLAFLQTTLLPMPTLVSSGGGVHVYWHFAEEIPAADFRVIAWHLRQLGDGLKVKLDPTRTTDSSSVLRVADTFNRKDRANPRPVKVLQEGVVTPVAAFRQLLSDALVRAGIVATDAPATRAVKPVDDHGLGTNMVFNDFGPKPTLSEVAAACGQVREIIRSQGDKTHPHYGPLDNTAWYRGLIGVVKHVEDGDNWCRKLTDLHPRSTADIEAKLLQQEQFPPARCETLQQFMPWKDVPCQTCRFRNDPSVPNPIAAARKSTTAPPPTSAPASPPAAPGSAPAALSTPATLQLMAPSTAFQSAMIPNPPKPYERLKVGGIALTRKDKDGNETTTVIYAHDLYPLKRLVNTEEGTEQQTWRTKLPRTGTRDFTIAADVLYDAKKFCVAIANNGIYPNKADIPALQDYMVAYISQLQKDLDGESQRSHLGWTDEHRAFILPDKTLFEDGSVRTSALTAAATNASQFITKRGDLQEQVKLMAFYNHNAYVANQFAILQAFASVIFYATGQHGIVVNMSGEAGASKSTTLYTAAGCFGDPMLWPINGTNRGATANARAQRVITNANLMTPVDEITHLPAKEAIDLVMNISQPGHRLRLQTDGTERKMTDNYKSAIMLSTANSSLHGLLSTDNAAGTAGSMRVFEMKFVAQSVHTKGEADEFLRQLKLHFGHLGEIFIAFVVKNRVAVENRVHQVVREIDTEAHIVSAERFWSADIACALVAGEICQALGLLPYDPLAIRQWVITRQVPFMRGVVKEEYRDPLAVLSDYIAERQGNIVVTDRATTIGNNTAGQAVAGESTYAVNQPHGSLEGHYDLKTRVLVLRKQGFKDYCSKVGASSSRILDELVQPRALGTEPPSRIVVNRNARRTLGAGTNLAKGQSWCFTVDMNHPEIAGAVPVLVSGGVTSGAPAGNLKVVT